MIETGKKFGKYTLLERLAAGGMAEIFKARVEGPDGFERIVAIKRLHKQFSEDQEFVTMLVDEAKLAVQLKHNNIGEVFDLERIDGQYFIVMEFINGLDLKELSERAMSQNRRLPLEALVYVASQAAGALHYAHNKLGPDGRPLDIVHRDVSPQNIMLSVDGDVKLVDFGIAKARQRAQHTRAGVIKGKFYYMSPEQAHGNRVDARSDVYALAMVLYEVLSGEHPFDRVPDEHLLRDVRMAKFAPISEVLPQLPRRLANIIDKALMRNAERRYRSARRMKDALQEFANEELPRFGAAELADLIRHYSAKHLPEQTRDAVDVLGAGEHRASENSLLFDAGQFFGGNEFDDDEATQVFTRDSGIDTSSQRLDARAETGVVEWDRENGDSGPSDQNPAGRTQPRSPNRRRTEEREELRRSARRGAGADNREVRRGAGADNREVDDSLDGASLAAPEPVVGSSEREPGEERQETAQIHHRLATGVIRRVEELYRQRPHIVGGGLSAVAVVLLGLSAWMLWAPDADEEEWDADVVGEETDFDGDAEINLPVSTTPANARVYLDGEMQGKTPLSLDSLQPGQSYSLRFEREGHESKELNVVAEVDMTPRVVRLEPLGGLVRVEAEPEGVEIYLDGDLQGPAPVTVMGLERELTHEIEARLAEDETKTEQVTWEEGDERVQELHFEFDVEEEEEEVAARERRARPSPQPQRQRSAPAPSGASQQPSTASGSGGGSARPLGGDETEAEEADDDGDLDIWGIGGEEQQGRLNVRVDADHARIYVDGQMVKDGATLIGHPLDAGSYEVRVFFPGSDKSVDPRTVEVRPGETSTVVFSP